jgi:drug/metabolite transporter (DMT)-like permease
MMSTDTSADNANILLALMPAVFVLIWSTGFVVARLGMPFSPPFTFLELRYLLSIAVFCIWILIAKVPWPRSRAQWFHIGITGVLMHAGYLGGVWAAVKAGMGSGLSALIVGLQPVLTALWLSHRGGEIKPRQWIGLLFGFLGLTLVLWNKLEQSTEISLKSGAFALMALMSISTGTLYQKRHVLACDVRTANTVQLIFAALATAPFCWLEAESFVLTQQSMIAMLWSVFVLTIGGSSLLYMLIQKGAASKVSSLMYLVPPCTAFMAWLIFNEPISLITLMGVFLTAFSVYLVIKTPVPSKESA